MIGGAAIIENIIGILAEHKRYGDPITLEKITVAVENLYGDMEQLDEKSVSFIRAVLDNGRFDEMYTAIRESERHTKSVLIAFEDKYPSMLRETDIESVVGNADRKSEDIMSVRATLEKLKKEQKPKN